MYNWILKKPNYQEKIDDCIVENYTTINELQSCCEKATVLIKLDPDIKELAVFNLFFSHNVYDDIVRRTNQEYLDQSVKCEKKTKKRRPWNDLTLQELNVYFGILIMLGIDKKPTFRMHWQTHGLWSSNLIKESMHLDRFELINKYLTIGIKGSNDKLGRIRNLSMHMQEGSLRFYKPCSKLSIDESLIKFKGRHSLKQYMPMKPNKWGFKAFLCCESTTGYCLKHIFFSGAKKKEFNPYNISISLAEGFSHQNYHIYADNWYSSVKLARDLKHSGIKYTGTIKKSAAELPNKLRLQTNTKRNSIVFLSKEGLRLVSWLDKRLVTVISNETEAYTFNKNRNIKGGGTEEVEIPLMIHDYRQYMGGVDLFDQRLQYYAYPHKCKKWWKYFFHFLIEIALNNSFVLFNENRKGIGLKAVSFLDFRLSVVKALVGWKEPQDSTIERMEIDQVEDEKHVISSTVLKKNCEYCVKQGIKSSCKYTCSICNVHLHKNCFEKFHNFS